MLKVMADAQKYTPPNDCTDEKLLNFADTVFVTGNCNRYYGEHKGPECSIKENYCSMCCSHFIGSNFTEKLNGCKETCNGLVKGEKRTAAPSEAKPDARFAQISSKKVKKIKKSKKHHNKKSRSEFI